MVFPKVDILGVKVASLTMAEVVDVVENAAYYAVALPSAKDEKGKPVNPRANRFDYAETKGAISVKRPAAGTGRAWAQRYGRAVMNTFGAPQRVLVRGRGARVWDADGAQYTDLLAGIAVNCLGHAHPAVVEAVTAQLSTLGHVSNFFTTPAQISLVDKLLHDGTPNRTWTHAR